MQLSTVSFLFPVWGERVVLQSLSGSQAPHSPPFLGWLPHHKASCAVLFCAGHGGARAGEHMPRGHCEEEQAQARASGERLSSLTHQDGEAMRWQVWLVATSSGHKYRSQLVFFFFPPFEPVLRLSAHSFDFLSTDGEAMCGPDLMKAL